jgi:putative peptidoglycan lipid II flippase
VALAMTARAVGRRLDGLDGRRVTQTYVRIIVASAVSAAAAFGVAELIAVLLGRGVSGSVVGLVAGAGIGIGILTTMAGRMRINEATRLVELVRARLGG